VGTTITPTPWRPMLDRRTGQRHRTDPDQDRLHVPTVSVRRQELTSSIPFSRLVVHVQNRPHAPKPNSWDRKLSSVGGRWNHHIDHPSSPWSECLMMSTRTVPAAQLHIGDLVLPATGPARRITLHRLQGTPPVVVLAYAGQPGQQALPAGQEVIVLAVGD
jgi:hypothetical protein